MAILYYKKINETYIQLASDEQYILKELSEYFSFYAEGYNYSPKFRARVWDGKIRLVNLRSMTTLAGLVPAIAKFCAERNYVLIDQTESYNKFVADDLSGFDDFISSLSLPFEPRDYQVSTAKYAIQAGRGLLLSSTGCHQKGTKIIMYDGSTKPVEDIRVGDLVMGPDGKQREVLRLYNGTSEMYKINPMRTPSFIVNGDHVLALWNCRKKKLDYIMVSDYINKSNVYKHVHYLLSNKQCIEFDQSSKMPLPLDPYFVGLYLGDGHSRACGITTADPEIEQYIREFCDKNGYGLRVCLTKSRASDYYIKKSDDLHVRRHPIFEAFDQVGVTFGNVDEHVSCGTKRIPDRYKQASVEDRYQLLAGLIDTDGYLANNSYYEYSSKSEQLVDDVIWVAGSLGYNCSKRIKVINGTSYYVTNILGDITKIPVRIARKKCTKVFNRNKDPRHQMFTVEHIGEGQYYGFELSDDHLYFTNDWIIHHNSGKSMMIYLLVRWMLKHDRKVCLIVPSTSLVEQMHSDFKNYASKDKSFDVDQQVHKLYAKIKSTDPYNDQCIITTWQSIKNYDKTLYQTWDCVIVDEAHGCKANIIDGILKGAVNAKYRFGLTGTLTGMICHEYQITGLLGSVYQATTTKDLQEKGFLSDCTIYMVDMKYPAEEAKKLWNETKLLKKTYQDEVDFVNHHVKRQLFIRNLVCSLKGTTLILFRFREHGELLYKLIKEKVGDSRPVYHIDGKVEATQREAIRQELKDPNSNAILVFSVATSSTGIDIKSIENLILSPSKSKVQTLQSIGRSLRLCEGKSGAKVFDLIDDLRTGKRRNFLYNLAQKRLEFYSEQGFDVQFKQVQF